MERYEMQGSSISICIWGGQILTMSIRINEAKRM